MNLPVDIAVMGTRWLRGEISAAYRNVSPRNPVGKKSEKRKIKAAGTPKDAVLDGCDDPPAMTAIQTPIPREETIINLRRPNLSTVRTPMGEHIVCQVNTEAATIFAALGVSPR